MFYTKNINNITIIKDLEKLYQLFELKVKVKDIQKILPYCIGTIAKQRKIWKQMKKE